MRIGNVKPDGKTKIKKQLVEYEKTERIEEVGERKREVNHFAKRLH